MKRSLGSNIVFDGESADYEDLRNAFGYDTVMYGWTKEQQAKAIKFCLTGKARKCFDQMSDDDKKNIDTIFDKLKSICFKAPEFYLNLFYSRVLKPDQSIRKFCHELQKLLERGMPVLDETVKGKMLRARLISSVPEHVKNFLELMTDKTWNAGSLWDHNE